MWREREVSRSVRPWELDRRPGSVLARSGPSLPQHAGSSELVGGSPTAELPLPVSSEFFGFERVKMGWWVEMRV